MSADGGPFGAYDDRSSIPSVIYTHKRRPRLTPVTAGYSPPNFCAFSAKGAVFRDAIAAVTAVTQEPL